MNLKKLISDAGKTILPGILLTIALPLLAQRQVENLDRGLVAVKVQNGVFLSWRTLGTEWYNVGYNVYRDGIKLNADPLAVSDYSDETGTTGSNYTVRAVTKGIEQSDSPSATPWLSQCKTIMLKYRDPYLYRINDCTAADLDGDGQYEIIVKRANSGDSLANNQYFTFFEAYKLDGTFLWEINVGPNILYDVEANIAAFDFDQDGKAEVYMRSSEGTIFGDGKQIGDTNNDGKTNYRDEMGYNSGLGFIRTGPEFLSLIDGMTGAELDRVNFIPRGNATDWVVGGKDDGGHRCSKYFFGAPYLDGKNPSLFIGRGIYTKTIMRTYDVVNKKLVFKWEFSATSTSDPYFGQGNHSYTVADVDRDGRDEIVWGAMTVDDNGKGLYSTELGHGDALHVGDLDPYRKGIEVFKCLEDYPVWGTAMWEGATGEVLLHHYYTKDCGRCCAANVSEKTKGTELWGGNMVYSASTHEPIANSLGLPENYRIYWDGDLLEECVDHDWGSGGIQTYTTLTGTGKIVKYNDQWGSASTILTSPGYSCNHSKGTPCLQADLFGDWREEVIWHRSDEQALLVYTTTDPTIYRNYTLMHDHQYRQAINWQMCGYNQPPHVSYFLGKAEGRILPPPPSISNGRLQYQGNGTWDKTSAIWLKDGQTVAFSNGDQVLFDAGNGREGSLTSLILSETLAPELLSVNSPGDYRLDASKGKLSGNMTLTKSGKGTFSLTGSHDFTGPTEVWDGRLNLEGELTNSPVLLEFFGELGARGKLNQLTMRYGSKLFVGGDDSTGVLETGSLFLDEKTELHFDLFAPSNPLNDSLVVNGKLILSDNVVFTIHPKLEPGKSKLASGEYLLARLNGGLDFNGISSLDSCWIEGLLGTPAKLALKENPLRIVLLVEGTRSAGSILWNGDVNGAIWDMSVTNNFINNNMADIFVDGDEVTFNDSAASKTVNIAERVTPSSLIVDAVSTYVFDGNGAICGPATLTKKGEGVLMVNNTNDFTGKVLIAGGTVRVTSLACSTAGGALGVVSDDVNNFEINDGLLHITAAGTAERALTVGNLGAAIQNDAKVLWLNRIVGGALAKLGAGELVLGNTNTQSQFILESGKLSLYDDSSTPGKSIVLKNGTVFQDCNSGSYRTCSWDVVVPEESAATYILNSAATYTGKLTGNGTLNINIPYVRSTITGDWSTFSGTLSFTSTISSGTAQLRLADSRSLPNAAVVINSAFHSGTKTMTPIAVTFGALSGAGSLAGFPGITVGTKNIDCIYTGSINNGADHNGVTIVSGLVKTGSASLTLSGNSSYTNGTVVKAGKLVVDNKTGSATGTGAVTVQNGAELSGKGIISGSVTVEQGGSLIPGTSSVGTKLTINSSLNLKQGSVLKVIANPLFDYVNQIVASGTVALAGNLIIENTTQTGFSVGDRFKLIVGETITGSFASISPETPGEGMVWDLTELNSSGVIQVAKGSSNETILADGLRFYPNPIMNELFIDSEGNRIGDRIQISDITGRKQIDLMISDCRLFRIDFSRFPAGIYLVRIDGANGTTSFKMIKK